MSGQRIIKIEDTRPGDSLWGIFELRSEAERIANEVNKVVEYWEKRGYIVIDVKY